MNNLTSTLGRFAVVLSGALALGACNRTEYATLPRSASYLNTATAVAKSRPAAPAAASPSSAAPAEASTLSPAIVTAPVAPAPVVTITLAPATPAIIAAPTTPKLNLVRRLALKKITKKIDKLVAEVTPFKQHEAQAARGGGLDSNLRYALVFGIVGIVLTLFDVRILTILGIIGIVIGLIFLLFWVLDQA